MIAQRIGFLGEADMDSTTIRAVTVRDFKRNMRAEVALAKMHHMDKGKLTLQKHWVGFGIIQVISETGIENFDSPRVIIFRRGVTSVTFYVEVHKARAAGRWVMHIWSKGGVGEHEGPNILSVVG